VCVCVSGEEKGDPDRNFRLTRFGETFRFDGESTFLNISFKMTFFSLPELEDGATRTEFFGFKGRIFPIFN
jgi:hypothetical protein